MCTGQAKEEKREESVLIARRREETWWCTSTFFFYFLKYKDLHVYGFDPPHGIFFCPHYDFLNTPARISCTAIFMR